MRNRRVPEKFPKDCRFWASFSGDEYVEYPGRKIFKLSDDGYVMLPRDRLPMSGCAPIAEATFLNCAATCRAFEEKRRFRHVKTGDIAIIVDGITDNLGFIVLVGTEYGVVDYTHIHRGFLQCWNVESLGGNLVTNSGSDRRGHIPDIALRPLPDVAPELSKAVRRTLANKLMDEALTELGKIFRQFDAERKEQTGGKP